jgi:hypothetical protein
MTNHRIARSSRRVVLLATAALAAVSLAAQARAATTSLADGWNEWEIPTLDPLTNTFGPTGIRYIYSGDAVSNGCIPAQLTDDTTVNAFYAEQSWPLGGGHAHQTTVVYDHALNETIVTLSGTKPLAVPAPPPNTPPLDPFPGPTDGNGSTSSYHNGLVAGFQSVCGTTNKFMKKQWEWTNASTKGVQYADIQVVQVGCECVINKENVKAGKEAIVYLEVADPATGLPVNGTWTFSPYPPNGGQTTFLLQNNGTSPVTLGNVGILTGVAQPNDKKCWTEPNCQGNQAFLDTMNNTYYPVTGANSPFTPVTNLIGTTLEPGETAEITANTP